MPDLQPKPTPKPSRPETVEQISSGGVAYKTNQAGLEVALISVGKQARWQLPKGIVDPGETPEATAVREVQEETGIRAKLLQKVETIEYWYVGNKGKQRVRFHKFVHFYLLVYEAGDIGKNDWEVNEARWVNLTAAKNMLSFKSERQVLEKAECLILEHKS